MIPSEWVCVLLLSPPVQTLMNGRHPRPRRLCNIWKLEQDEIYEFFSSDNKVVSSFLSFFVIFSWILG